MQWIVQAIDKIGLPVAFVVIMVWLYNKKEDQSSSDRKSHRQERNEWRDTQVKLQGETNGAIKDLTRAIGFLERKIKD